MAREMVVGCTVASAQPGVLRLMWINDSMATAPHDKDVSESLSLATSRYRQAIQAVVKHLIDLDALREEFDETYALDVLWFYFGYWGLYSLHNENGWTYEKAERWLCEAATSALLRVRHPTKPSPAHELDV